MLGSADKLQRLCAEAYAALYDSDEAALARLGTVWKRVAELADVDPAFQPHLDARDAIKSQLEDLAQTLRAYGEHIDASPARLQEVEDRLALVERLKRKYGPALADVIAKREALSRQLDALENADERRAGLEAETLAARERVSDARPRAVAEAPRGARSSSPLASRRCSASWRWGARSSKSGSRRSRPSRRGPKPASTSPSAISRPTSGEDLRPLARIAQRRRALARDAGHSNAGRGGRAGQDADLR